MSTKLNSMRVLEQHGITYDVLQYSDTLRDAQEVADAVRRPYAVVYKTLVVQIADDPRAKKPCLFLIPADCQLNLKKAARAVPTKKVKMASLRDAEQLTGLKVGGISPLALTHKQWAVFIDQRAGVLEEIVISAGQRGLQIEASCAALIDLLSAKLVDVADAGTPATDI